MPLRAIERTLKQHDLGLILDFVPNHVGRAFSPTIHGGSMCWNGSGLAARVSSTSTGTCLPYRARGGVLLPIIGSSYGQRLEKGEIELRYDATKAVSRHGIRTSPADRTERYARFS